MPRGFTLIEVLVTVALSAVLMLAITQLYVVYGRIVLFQKSSISVALGGSNIMDATRTAGLQAKRVVATHIFSGISYDSGTTTAIFELPAVDASGAIMAGAYDYIGIHASGTSAYRLVDAALGSSRVSGEKRLTDVLGALNFSYDDSNFPSVTSVTVDATTSAVVRGETTQVHLSGRIYLRNL
ncbi:MAG: prepilin-type N-terminal cleavage/methylation domain-containing protein [Patescibacteria group bacterium]